MQAQLDSGIHLIPQYETPKFSEIYERYFSLVWRTARRLGVAEAALDDVCQEVFLAVYRQLPNYSGQSTVRTWVFGFILNVVQVHHRSLRRKSTYHRAVGELVDPDTLTDGRQPSAYQYVRSNEALSIARIALADIDEDKRALFVMAALEGFTASEISDTLGLNVNTVYSRVRSARRQFQRLVRKQLVPGSVE